MEAPAGYNAMWLWVLISFYTGLIYGIIMSAILVVAKDEDNLPL